MEGEHQSTSCGHGEVLHPGLCWAVEARERVGYDPKELTMGDGVCWGRTYEAHRRKAKY